MPLKQLDIFQLEQAGQPWSQGGSAPLHKNTTITPPKCSERGETTVTEHAPLKSTN